MAGWLLDRLFEKGDQPTPRFAAQSTLNWMRALAILVQVRDFTSEELSSLHSNVQRRTPNKAADTGVFEHLLMAQHNLAALDSLSNNLASPYNVVRSAIVAWYYVVYESASSMTLAASGANAEEHRKTARIWHAGIVTKDLAPGPFGLHLDTLVRSEVKARLAVLREGSMFALVESPANYSEAWGAACAYVSGTADYEQKRIETRVRATPEFRNLSVESFQKKSARELRDRAFAREHVNFLVQAFRYRGKANYRDSIYLSYGPNREDGIRQFLVDLAVVGAAFLRMASSYASRRVERGVWARFDADLVKYSRLSLTSELFHSS